MKVPHARAALFILGGLCVPLPVLGQTACTAEAHRAFDFWVGAWRVEAANGTLAGHNTISSILGGCVLHEVYTTPRGYEGESLNMYDASRDMWHQTWVDNSGLLLRLQGGFDGSRMVMQGETLDADARSILNRITWSIADGDPNRVRQLWEISSDGGSTWRVSFDGLYLREEPQG
jgi:hypothetical protein